MQSLHGEHIFWRCKTWLLSSGKAKVIWTHHDQCPSSEQYLRDLHLSCFLHWHFAKEWPVPRRYELKHLGLAEMASLTRWTWVWVNSGSWWWTGRPGLLQFMGLQRVRHNWATELNWNVTKLATSSVIAQSKLNLQSDYNWWIRREGVWVRTVLILPVCPSEASQDESQVGGRMRNIIRTKSFDVRKD